MSSEHRAIVLENNDPNITYVGEGWIVVGANDLNDVGNWGPAFSPILHSTKTNSSFTFTFHGSSISVIGTDNVANISTDPDPTWQCFVDGTSLGQSNLEGSIENNWVLCSNSSLPDGLHELTVNVTSRGMPFYLDTLQYRASPSVSLENTLIAIYPGDPAINYISGWSPLPGVGGNPNQTSDPNGLVNVTFIGTQLSWYGFTSANRQNTSIGEYSIDGKPFENFQVSNASLLDPSTSGDNQLLLTIPSLDMENHVLSVRYTGIPGQNALTLEYLFITNGSFPSSSPTSSVNGSKNSSPVNVFKKNSSTAGIVGGVVGSIVGVVVVVTIVFTWYISCRRRGQRDSTRGNTSVMPFLPQPTSAPPPRIHEVLKDHIQPLSARNSNSNLINPTSLFTTPSQISSPGMAAVSGGIDPPRSLPHASSPNTLHPRIPIQHEDSGIRLAPSLVHEDIEIPPTYTEQ